MLLRFGDNADICAVDDCQIVAARNSMFKAATALALAGRRCGCPAAHPLVASAATGQA